MSEKVVFTSGNLELEGILDLPEDPAGHPGAVLCHPHPLYGGDMHNAVIIAIYEALSEFSIATLRFNMRGVGASGGTHDHGVGEQHDVLAALSFLSTRVDRDRLALAGYSFGAVVAIAAAPQSRARVVALVSPAGRLEGLENFTGPSLVITGEEDSLAEGKLLPQVAAGLSSPCEVEIVPGADHFWWNQERYVGHRVAAFLARSFGQPTPA